MKQFFIWLGSGRSRKWDVGAKAQYLDQAAQAGLPVPAGAILLDEFFQLALAEGVIVAGEHGAFTAPDPQWLSETLFEGVRLPHLGKPAAVRAAVPLTGYVPRLTVDLNDPVELSRSLCTVWSLAAQGEARRDVLIMAMVTGDEAGTAVSHHTTKTDQIPPFNLVQLGAWQRPSKALPPHVQRLQQLLRGIRRTFGARNWVVDWVDDGRICWLLQISRQ